MIKNTLKKRKREYIYGVSSCLAALLAERRKIHRVYLNEKFQTKTPTNDDMCEIISEVGSQNHNVKYSSKQLLDRLSASRPHQGVVIDTSSLSYERFRGNLEPESENSFWLALDKIHDPMNLGAIIRSAVYFGVEKIVVTENNSCSLTPVVSKASSGAMEWHPIYSTVSIRKFLMDAKRSGWDVIGTSVSCSVTPAHKFRLKGPSILVFGNEGAGLEENILSTCSTLVTIPSTNPNIPSTIDSLNVSVSAAIILHSLMSDRST